MQVGPVEDFEVIELHVAAAYDPPVIDVFMMGCSVYCVYYDEVSNVGLVDSNFDTSATIPYMYASQTKEIPLGGVELCQAKGKRLFITRLHIEG